MRIDPDKILSAPSMIAPTSPAAMLVGTSLEAVFPTPPVLTLTTDSQLRILSACATLSSFTGYDQKDLKGLNLGYLVEEDDRFNVLRAGILAVVGLHQQITLSIATCKGTHCTLVGEVCATVLHGQQCLLWTLRKEVPPVSLPNRNATMVN